MDLILDQAGKAARGAAPDGPATGDVRVTAALSKSAERIRCSQTLLLGAQGNVAQGVAPGPSFIFNAVPTASTRDGGVDLEFQLEYRPRAGADLLQVQNEQTLALGRVSRAQLSGYEFDLLAESAAPSSMGSVSATRGGRTAASAPRAAP
ncbi:MAG: hypothetical protein HKL90_09615 [Elusimicrobia bacterium]|nr:hypothetical protein [Elusimicrobiota bacterium]